MLISTHICLVLFLTTKMTYGQIISSPCSCDQPDSDFAADVNLLYYKCNNETPATIAYPITAPQDLLNVLDENKRTIFYIFGYSQDPSNTDTIAMTEALCFGNTDNIVLVDWTKYSKGRSEIFIINAEKVGILFARSLQLLQDGGLDTRNIYIIGHSIASHIAGRAGKCTNFTVPRITGLDPANRLFYPTGCHLSPKDASWVDVIHTDVGVIGTAEYMGTAEYYVNSGTRPQPGCKLFDVPESQDICSHFRSLQIYEQSKYQPDKYIAVECPSYEMFELNLCKDNRKTGVGYAASNVTGKYYFAAGPMET